MNTTAIRSKIKAGEAQPKHDQSGMTKLLLAIPVDLRTGLAELSAAPGVSQQEIVRQALRGCGRTAPSAIQVTLHQHGQDRQGPGADREGQGCEDRPPGHAHGLHREDRQRALCTLTCQPPNRPRPSPGHPNPPLTTSGSYVARGATGGSRSPEVRIPFSPVPTKTGARGAKRPAPGLFSGTEEVMKLARINLNLPADLYRQVRPQPKLQDRTVTTVLTRALEQYLAANHQEPNTTDTKGRHLVPGTRHREMLRF